MRMTTSPSFGRSYDPGPLPLKEALQIYFSILFGVAVLSLAFYMLPF